MNCKHEDYDTEGTIHERNKHGVEVAVNSYRCNKCGVIWTDRKAPVQPTKRQEEKKMTNGNGNGNGKAKAPKTPKAAKPKADAPNKRLENAKSDGWVMGKIYKRDWTTKGGKVKTCTMKMTKEGFVDHNGKVWSTPTALVTTFVVKECGAAEGTRRPAKAFFPDAPAAKKVATRTAAPKKVPVKKATKKSVAAAVAKAAQAVAKTPEPPAAAEPTGDSLPPPIELG